MNRGKTLPMKLQFFADPETDPEKEPEKEPAKEPEQKEEPKDPEPTKEPKKESEKEPETKEPEKKDPKPEDNSEKLEELKRKLAEAQEYKNKYEEAAKFKSEYEKAQEELHKYESSLTKIAEQKIEALPEEYRGLVPEGNTQDKLDWLAKAEKSGLFGKKEERSIGQSTKVNHKQSAQVELKDMTPNQKLISGIKDFYSRSK